MLEFDDLELNTIIIHVTGQEYVVTKLVNRYNPNKWIRDSVVLTQLDKNNCIPTVTDQFDRMWWNKYVWRLHPLHLAGHKGRIKKYLDDLIKL